MYGAERRQVLVQRARRDGRVDVSPASEELAVTPETIRRDLGVLERQGALRRVYGGAVPVERVDFEPSVTLRDRTSEAEKERIARAAVDQLPERGTVLLDGGTTTARLAGLVPDGVELTVVTNSLPAANRLVVRPGCELHLLGGRVRATTLASVGTWGQDVLDGLTVDVGFFGTNGFSYARGCTTPDPAESAVKAAMVRACRRRVLLADHTKYGDDHFSRFARLEEMDVVVTDGGIDERAREELTGAEADVVVV
ncbi:DeoR/GlpR family DNA-binding transcription regulator [Streptomonospora wellingtoniae]|uniref:Lactose phosphotransferase system repressor n=1 Tax=Streptomonospora wellingtoniae TaxID=3075544 RepID=A0ABU2L067_9ACTN|nr:DeoR/GlpR family DNA-binding transcription regulator [Streptomonospora sp. DSM 45055]MDT0304951.1 DeoR/GlpR family DNA-binding transcription regulator [Streptomonospora sp. DSM 45055]